MWKDAQHLSLLEKCKSKLYEGLPWWLWQRICLPMHEAWVRSLFQEDPHATKPLHHTAEPVLCILGAATTEAHVPLSPCSAATEKWNEKQLENSPLWPQIREKPEQPWRTSAAKINKQIYKKNYLRKRYQNQVDYLLCSWWWRSSTQLAKTRLGDYCVSHHELFIVKMRLKLK